MIHLANHNKKNGFTFIEIIIAITMIGIVLLALFNLQSSLFNNAIKQHGKISRIYYLKNLFFDYKTSEKIIKDKKINVNIEYPPTNIIFQLINPNDKSILKKFDDIFLLKSSGSWQGLRSEQNEMIASLLFVPKKPTKEKKK